MPTYRWSGIDRTGKKFTGIEKAHSKTQLKTDLINQNIFPLKIAVSFPTISSSLRTIKTKHISQLIDQLSVLINANIPIIKALEIIGQDQQNCKIKTLANECKLSISDGKTLYQTLNHYPQYFNELICNLVNAGEQSGSLDVVLREISNHLKKSELQKNKIIKALLYPISILVITLIVTMIMLIFVIPQFETMFSNFGAKLPIYTRLIIKASHLLQATWLYLLTAILAAIISLKALLHHSAKFRLFSDTISLHTPLIKNIVTAATIARFAKTMDLTLKSGIPLISAINISTTTVQNLPYRHALQATIKLVADGQPLHNALSKQTVFPNRVIQLIMLGEETGTLDAMLAKISSIYDEELTNISDTLNNLLEPIIMLVLGTLVGGLVVAMYLPIFRLGTII